MYVLRHGTRTGACLDVPASWAVDPWSFANLLRFKCVRTRQFAKPEVFHVFAFSSVCN